MVKPVAYPNVPPVGAENIFGNNTIFSNTPVQRNPAVQDLFSAKPQGAELSPAAQSALEDINAMEAQAAQVGQRVAQLEAQQQRQIQNLAKQANARAEELQRQAQELRKAQEKAAKELEKTLKKDATTLVKEDIDALLNRDDYKNAGDLRRGHILAQEAEKLRNRLRQQGLDEASIETSVRAFIGTVESDIARYKKEASGGPINTIFDFGKMVVKAWNDIQAANDTKDAALIDEARQSLVKVGRTTGWGLEEALERDQSIRQYLVRDGVFDSTANWSLRSDLTPAQIKELEDKLQATYDSAVADQQVNIREAQEANDSVSAEQKRERDNLYFEYEQVKARIPEEQRNTFLGHFNEARYSASITAKYPTTFFIEQSGSLAIGIGAGAVETAVGALAASATGGSSLALSAKGVLRTVNTLRKVANAAVSGVASAKMVEADVINSARDEIMATDIATLRNSNPELWADLLKISGGNEELARQRLATMKADDNAGKALLLGAAAGIVGSESLLGRAIAKTALRRSVLDRLEDLAGQSTAGVLGREVAKNVALWAVGTAAEGAEEGYTTYLTNMTVRNVNPDKDEWDGVASAVGIGIAGGAILSSGAVTRSINFDIRNEVDRRNKAASLAPLSDAAIEARVSQYVELGNVNYNELIKQAMTDLTSFDSEMSTAFANSPEAIAAQRQMYYDTYIDNEAIISRLTPAQAKQFKEHLGQAFRGQINTNNYDTAKDTAFMQALRDSTTAPTDNILADVWRIVHNKELDKVTDVTLANSLAKIYKQMFPNGNNTVETTRQRVGRLTDITRDVVLENSAITKDIKHQLLRISAQYFDATTRRIGDESAQNSTEQTQTGNTGSDTQQTADSQDANGGVQTSPQTNQTEQAQAGNAGQATANNESSGDGTTRQAGAPQGSPAPTSRDGETTQPDTSQSGEASQTTTPADTTGQTQLPSQATTSTRSAGQATQASGPTVTANTTPTTTPAGSGVAGTTQTERSADGQRSQTTTPSESVGGANGQTNATQNETGFGDGSFSTEVRNAKNVTIGVRGKGEEETRSFQAHEFKRVSLKEHGVFLRTNAADLWGSPSNAEKYLMNASAETLVFMHNKHLALGVNANGTDWVALVQREWDRRAYASQLPTRPRDAQEQSIYDTTTVADSVGMVASRQGRDGIVLISQGEVVFMPYDGSIAFVMDNTNATLTQYGLTAPVSDVKRSRAYQNRLKNPRTESDKIFKELEQALRTEESIFSFATEPTAVKSGKVQSQEVLDAKLETAIDSIMNQLDMTVDEALDFIEYTVAGKLYNDGEFNNLERQDQVQLVQNLATELMHDPNSSTLYKASLANKGIAQQEQLQSRLLQSGVHTDMVWQDIYSRFNRAELVKVHGKTDPIVGTTDLVRELQSIKKAAKTATSRIIPDTLSNISPESTTTLNTLVRVINDQNKTDLLATGNTTPQEVALSLLQANDNARKKFITSYAKLVPESDRKVFRKALTSLTNDLIDTNAVAREVALSEATKPSYKRKTVQRKITPKLRSKASTRTDTQLPNGGNTNETQNTRSQQPATTQTTTNEREADSVRQNNTANDQARAVRGPSAETSSTTQSQTQNEINSTETSSERTSDTAEADGTNVPSASTEPNQSTKRARKRTGKGTGNTKGKVTKISSSDLANATPASEIFATESVVVTNNGPVELGNNPSDQLVILEPVVIGETSIESAKVEEGEYTPSEQTPDGKFDSPPVTQTASDGTTVEEVVIALSESFGFSDNDITSDNKTETKAGKKKLKSKKVKAKRPELETRKDRLYTSETALANAVAEELFKTVQEENSNTGKWLEYLLANDHNDHLVELINSTAYIQSGIDAVMSDTSVASARAPFEDWWHWDKKSTDPAYRDKKYFSISAGARKISSHLAGITPYFDDWLNAMPNVPRSGIAQDSAKPSASLAKINSQKNAIYGFIHKTYIDPVLNLMENMTFKYTKASNISKDFGNYAKYRHALEEYGSSLLKNLNTERDVIKDRIDVEVGKIADLVGVDVDIDQLLDSEQAQSSLESTLPKAQRDTFNTLIKQYDRLVKEHKKATNLATNTQRVWSGEASKQDHPEVRLPDGKTKAELESAIAELEAKYEKADLETVANKIYSAYDGIRLTGATYGAYSPSDLAEFNNNGYKKYVYMGRGKKDKPSEFEEDIVNESWFDDFDKSNLVEQYDTLGLTRDLSKYRRKGSRSEMDDAITNLGRMARNIAGRSASAEFEQDIQGLFEGTLNQPQVDARPTTDVLSNYKSNIVQQGAVRGLVRIRADLPNKYMPEEFKHIIPVVAKGWEIDENGNYNLVAYKYFFTDPVIQNELTKTVDINSKWNSNVITSNIRTLTRIKASFMTSRNPLWNIWNFSRELMERGVTIMFRPVVDDNGKRISGTKLAGLFGRNLISLSTDLKAQEEIYRYLAYRERNTPLQRELHNLYTSGSLQLITDITDKFDFLGEQERSTLENLGTKVHKVAKSLSKETHFTARAVLTTEKAVNWYHMRIAEVPQIVNALSMHRAFKQAGVNTAEANHRVRDAFDPARTKSGFVQGLSNYLPFIRSTGAGNYNTMRTIGDAFLRGSKRDKANALLKLSLLGLGAYATLVAASYAFGTDEDDNDLIAQIPQAELNRGVPFKLSDDKVIYLPVGHGLPSVIWSIASTIYKMVHGTANTGDLAKNVFDQTMKNSLPANAPTADAVANSGGKAIFLNTMPMMALPITEVILNQTQFGNNSIIRQATPSGEKDSDQDNFNTPDIYKDMAKDINRMTGGAIDWRPEHIHHVVRSYLGAGPLRSIDAYLQDKGEKTAGVFRNKGEVMGPLVTLIGADLGISTSVLSNEARYYRLSEESTKLIKKYDVPVTMPKGKTYQKVDLSGIDTSGINFSRDTRAERYAHQLKSAGATDEEIQFVVNMTLANSERKKLRETLQQKGRELYNRNHRAEATTTTLADVREAAESLDRLYYDAVINNNQYVYGKK